MWFCESLFLILYKKKLTLTQIDGRTDGRACESVKEVYDSEARQGRSVYRKGKQARFTGSRCAASRAVSCADCVCVCRVAALLSPDHKTLLSADHYSVFGFFSGTVDLF